MMTKLHLADGLSLPLEAVTDTFAILAVRGVGKTHTASVLAEEMLKAGQPIVAYDPTGAWWGLKSSRDGKRAGFPVVIFGGEHADVPLEETAGATIATTIVEKRIPAVLDCLLMRKAARVRFMTDFCETLYHKNREALHLFLDEAHTVAPQNIRAMPEAARLLGAVEDIVLQGRRRGLGLTAISQRPALLNTNIRSQCMTLIAMRLFGKHDRKAIDEWIEAHGDPATAEQMLTDLAALPKGDAWVWNAAAGLFKRVHLRDRETFDSSATPKVGGRVITPQKMAEVDLDALGDAIRATVEKARADDPKELRKQIADLTRQLQQRPAESRTVEVEKVVQVPVLKDGQLARVEAILERAEAAGEKLIGEAAELRRVITPATGGLAGRSAAPGPPKPLPANPKPPIAQRPAQNMRQNIHAEPAEGLSRPQQRILDALAWLKSIGFPVASKIQVAFLAGYTPDGGAFNNVLGQCRTAGWVDYPRPSHVTLTDAGRMLTSEPAAPLTVEELHRAVMDRLNGPQWRVLKPLLDAYPNALTKDDLAPAAGYTPDGGAFNNTVGSLRSLGLIDYPARGQVVALPVLFLE